MGTSGFDPGKSGRFPAYKKPHPDWGLICGVVLAMLALVGLLVFLVSR